MRDRIIDRCLWFLIGVNTGLIVGGFVQWYNELDDDRILND